MAVPNFPLVPHDLKIWGLQTDSPSGPQPVIIDSMGNARITPRQQACLVGLFQEMTWKEIGARLGVGWRTVGRHIAQARLALGEDPGELIERSVLISRAVDAGIVQPGMRLSEGGYIVFSVKSVVGGRTTS